MGYEKTVQLESISQTWRPQIFNVTSLNWNVARMDFLTPQLFLDPMVAWVYPVSTPDHYGKAAKKRMQISELHFTCHLHFVCCQFLFVGCFGSDIFICASHPPVLVRAKSVVTTLSRYGVVNVGSQCFRFRTRYRRRTFQLADNTFSLTVLTGLLVVRSVTYA